MSAHPLGARPEYPLTPEQRRALHTLQDYDLTPVRRRLLVEGVLPSASVDEAIFEFRRYLGLRFVVPDRMVMCSERIDAVWHTCLLFTRLYADLCQRAFGHFVHHEPDHELHTPRDAEARLRQFRDRYRSLYGEDVGPLWSPVVVETTEEDIDSLEEKLGAFARSLLPGERGVLEQWLALAADAHADAPSAAAVEPRAVG